MQKTTVFPHNDNIKGFLESIPELLHRLHLINDALRAHDVENGLFIKDVVMRVSIIRRKWFLVPENDYYYALDLMSMQRHLRQLIFGEEALSKLPHEEEGRSVWGETKRHLFWCRDWLQEWDFHCLRTYGTMSFPDILSQVTGPRVLQLIPEKNYQPYAEELGLDYQMPQRCSMVQDDGKTRNALVEYLEAERAETIVVQGSHGTKMHAYRDVHNRRIYLLSEGQHAADALGERGIVIRVDEGKGSYHYDFIDLEGRLLISEAKAKHVPLCSMNCIIAEGEDAWYQFDYEGNILRKTPKNKVKEDHE